MRINPRLPADWPQASLTVHRRGTVIQLRVVQDDTVPPSMTVNGRSLSEQLIPWPDEKKLTIVVTVSRESQ
jgi:cellobiose phosphorylase